MGTFPFAMERGAETTRDEYILMQFRDNIALYRVLFVGQAIAGVGGVFLVIAALAMGWGMDSLGIVPAIGYLFTASVFAREKAREFEAGLAEIEADPVDIVRAYRFSPETEDLVKWVQHSHKTLVQLIASYGIIMVSLFAVSALCLAFWQTGLVYLIAGSITLCMALGMTVLTVQAVRNLVITKRLDA